MPPVRQSGNSNQQYMPNQRSINKKQLSVWVQDIKEIDDYCKETGKNRTEVIQELINKLKDKRQKRKK